MRSSSIADTEPGTRGGILKKSYAIRWSVTAIISAILALSAWAVSSPIGSSPDDDFHNPSIWCGQGAREDLCETGSDPNTSLVPQTLTNNSSCFAFNNAASGVCTESTALAQAYRVNLHNGGYPPFYYWATSWLASDDLTASILGIRIANSILGVLLIAVLVWLLPKHLRQIPVLSLIATAVPLGMFTIASVNPSSWAILAIAIFFPSVIGLVRAESWQKALPFAALAGLSFLMGSGSRADSGAFLLLAGALAVLIALPKKYITAVKPLPRALIIAVGVGVFVFMLSTSNTVSQWIATSMNLGLGTLLASGLQNVRSLPDLFVGAFGYWALGWLDTYLPSSVWAITFGIFFALFFASIKNFSTRQTIAAVAAFGALIIVPLVTLAVQGYVVGQWVQPRYLVPLLTLLLAVALYRGSSSKGVGLSSGQIFFIGLGLVVANAISLHTNLRRYLTGLDFNEISLDTAIEWWWVTKPAGDPLFWFSPGNVWLGGVIAFALVFFSLWKLRFELGISDPKTRANESPELETTKGPSQGK
jgi:hypothetical protein